MKKKNILLTIGTMFLVSAFASCGTTNNTSLESIGSSEESTISSNSISEVESSEESVMSSNITSEVESSEESSMEQNSEVVSDEEPVLETKKLFIVGDSTACSFDDATYYYPRYGFGTQFENYFYSSLEIHNLALSGRSSKSFSLESNYSTLKNNLSSGDYLLIAFGHNDEKSDDTARFTDASLPITDSNSFKYSLYENYIKLAEEKGANPILVTPIVRLSTSNDYSGSNGHITGTGNYTEAIKELGVEKEVPVVDLTSSTKTLYTNLGYSEAQWFHAMTTGMKDSDGNVVANVNSIDKTHLNIYGAKMVAYMFARDLKDSDSTLKTYVKETLIEPTKEVDLVANDKYVYSDYNAPDLVNYKPVSQFSTITEGWYGTAFGDTGGDPLSDSNGYMAKEETAGVFKVGQIKDGTSYKGKLSSSTEGFAYMFKQVDASKNFTLTVDARVLTELDQKQAGFGLMLRDDCYLPTRDASLKGNSISSALLCDSDFMNVFFSRNGGTLSKGNDKVTGLYQVDDTAVITITRLGQKVTTTLTYKDVTYTKEYLDFPLKERDQNNMYIGMFATRGTTVEFTNVSFEITGDAIEA